MKVKFNQKFKSIENFTETEIQDFSVFVGKNGSGKTHLLKAINEGFVNVDNVQKDETAYFNFQTFIIRNQRSIALRHLDDEKLQAWNIIVSQKNTFKTYDDQIKNIVSQSEYPYNYEPAEVQKAQYNQLIKNVGNIIQNHTQSNPKIRKLIKTGIFKSGKYASEITQAEFMRYSNYNPDDYELLESLSEMFLDYQKKLAIAELPKKDAGDELKDDEILKLKEQSPWNFVNKMFKEFGLPHIITHPMLKAGDFIQSQSVPFQVKLSVDSEEIDFDDLSSGEKILCSLALTVYQDNKSKFPKILLLDEIDASLHPSMIENLLDVIENVFIKNNCKVILATHSPTTAALVAEESLFEVQAGNISEKIRKISQSDAINVLSEGIITFEKGLKIYNRVDKSKKLQVITEGKNTEHIEKAIKVLDSTLLVDIKIIAGAEDKTGNKQLKNAFDVMSKAYNNSKFLFVWDCDSIEIVSSVTETSNFLKMCFGENTNNTRARDKENKAIGIENLYPDSLFTDDVYFNKETELPYGGVKTEKVFDKNKFLKKIKKETSPDIFVNFKSLVEKIKEILSLDN